MAMMAVKLEENSRRRSITMVNHEAPEERCVKRRRRDVGALALDCKNEPILETGQGSPTTVKRSSKYRGVSRHRWTGRFEAHLWDKLSWNVSNYEKEIEIMEDLTKEEYLASLRRGVARHHHNGRWEARIGRVFGNKYLYLGTYSNTYITWLKPIAKTPLVSHVSQTYIKSNMMSSNTFKEPQTPFLESHDFVAEGQRSYGKQKSPETKLPFSPSQKSSQTALGLLLRSSMFRELVEKNVNSSNEDEREDIKTQMAISCGGTDDSIEFLDSLNAINARFEGDFDFSYEF
ncbi:AP2/ERF domain-containing protein [Cynara cardunculus var. scolymus]|uniref:AP2/ERF domain-containing protein n=1 Tax=Cynara cardunculus var. scolymus TaxID=59895 RepID=A0A103XL09_CYNCS|nr:AP2/ERF domain-containing protein [Cynara cardunculus var. scolymus]